MSETTHGVRHVEHDLPERVSPGEVFPVRLALENTGTLAWRATSPAGDHFGLAVLWDGEVVANHPLPRAEVPPGERVTLHFAVDAPLAPGAHRLTLKMVQYLVTLFEDRGSPPLEVEIEVEDRPPDRGADLWVKLQRFDPWQHLPTRGISRSRRGGGYPVIVDRAQGYRLVDTEGREYVDWTMGWGAILLGHAHPRVQAALREALESSPLVCLPREDELEVARLLVEDFPGAEMACFGKNGSDACTFAARMARVFTGRRTILYSGYHGWQDFWVEQHGFDGTGVPPREPALIHRFPAHDLEAFERLVEAHRADLAAVFLEPSPWAGEGIGFEPDPSPEHLRAVADRTREAGALLVLDEIVTGYRYPEGGVQQAKGVVPDLTCLGKSIASGMPLSAVVGRADVFKQALPRTFYAATFHAESYSFAAARAAIEVYRTEPVAEHVWTIGERLRAGIVERCAAHGVPARVTGPPFRMSFVFDEPDRERERLARTLLHQELLRAGVYTLVGVMLPCYAHDDEALERTLAAFDRALGALARARGENAWDELVEIPPVPDH